MVIIEVDVHGCGSDHPRSHLRPLFGISTTRFELFLADRFLCNLFGLQDDFA